ncbi:MBG domain-containing protein, partial [Arcobacter sp. CECT 9188]|uniref:MBG domain-containing protein n=1 Tax=Arcobacter sp. CECT 9188 TaxID=2044505 RepID=UPI000DFADB12
LENLTTSGTNAGTYNTNLGLGTYVGNYNLTFEQGKLVIAKADATVTVNSDLNKVYNGQTQSVNGFTVDGLVNNEQSSVLVGLENLTTSGTNAGTYNTNLGLGTYVGNYNLTFEQGKLVIAKADATVTANSDLNKVYNGQIQSVNGFTVD